LELKFSPEPITEQTPTKTCEAVLSFKNGGGVRRSVHGFGYARCRLGNGGDAPQEAFGQYLAAKRAVSHALLKAFSTEGIDNDAAKAIADTFAPMVQLKEAGLKSRVPEEVSKEVSSSSVSHLIKAAAASLLKPYMLSVGDGKQTETILSVPYGYALDNLDDGLKVLRILAEVHFEQWVLVRDDALTGMYVNEVLSRDEWGIPEYGRSIVLRIRPSFPEVERAPNQAR
jgi:hypothetical protein